MTRYKSAQFAPDGDWITDYRESASPEEVMRRVADQGSRWFFYPFPVVIIDHGPVTVERQRIIDAAEPFEAFRGKTLRTFGRWLADNPEVVAAILS